MTDHWLELLAGRCLATPLEQIILASLRPLGSGYGLLQAVRAAAYRRRWLPSFRAPCPVVSVGNLTSGGTGKTPLVAWIGRYLSAAGVPIAIVSRGYKNRSSDAVTCVADRSGIRLTPPVAADEAFMLARQLPGVPILTSPHRRLATAMAVDKFGAQGILLDDGFQHLAVARDLNLVLIDSHAPFGNGRLLPAGLLRESPSALLRSDAVIMTRADQEEAVMTTTMAWLRDVAPNRPLLRAIHRPLAWLPLNDQRTPRPLSQLQGEIVFAFCAIAQPQSFRQTLEQLGLSVSGMMTFRDHHFFTTDDYTAIMQRARASGATAVVCTEKDMVKIKLSKPVFSLSCYALAIEIAFPEPPVWLQQRLQQLFAI
ncbi:MAG: tetraacyldisaccharide 4'-kinase [Magnetococcales bacterium]|nr:tetraacyldisaccharide 4'-kinase [Magnetococcales bacterium]